MQQVNLYLPELRPRRDWLTGNTIVYSALGFAVLLGLAALLRAQALEGYERRLALLEGQNTAIESRIREVSAQPLSLNVVQLDQKLRRLRREITAREQIGRIIEGQNLGNQQGFSDAMKGLARHAQESIALQRIRISRGGGFVELRGMTHNPEQVPQYLQRIRGEPSLSNTQFGLFSVHKKKEENAHRFSLGFESLYQLASDREEF